MFMESMVSAAKSQKWSAGKPYLSQVAGHFLVFISPPSQSVLVTNGYLVFTQMISMKAFWLSVAVTHGFWCFCHEDTL